MLCYCGHNDIEGVVYVSFVVTVRNIRCSTSDVCGSRLQVNINGVKAMSLFAEKKCFYVFSQKFLSFFLSVNFLYVFCFYVFSQKFLSFFSFLSFL